ARAPDRPLGLRGRRRSDRLAGRDRGPSPAVNPAVPQEATYASLGQRSLAALIDNVAWLIVISQIAASIPASVYDDERVVVGVIFLALLSAWFNYFWFAEGKWGKTIGKAVVGSRGTSEERGRAGFGPTTIRNVLRLVDVLLIGPLLIASSDRRQRLGEPLAPPVLAPHPPPPRAGEPN